MNQTGPDYAKLLSIQHALEPLPDFGNFNIGRGWNMSVLTYVESQTIDVVENCFAFMFTNIGDVIARVNGMVIFPNPFPLVNVGTSRSISGHLLDLYKGRIDLVFNNPPVGVAPLVEIVQLYYVPGKFPFCQI